MPLLVARCSSSVHGSNLEVDCAAARATVNSLGLPTPAPRLPGSRAAYHQRHTRSVPHSHALNIRHRPVQGYFVGDPFAVGGGGGGGGRAARLSAHRILDAVPAAGEPCALVAEARWSPSAVVRLMPRNFPGCRGPFDLTGILCRCTASLLWMLPPGPRADVGCCLKWSARWAVSRNCVRIYRVYTNTCNMHARPPGVQAAPADLDAAWEFARQHTAAIAVDTTAAAAGKVLCCLIAAAK